MFVVQLELRRKRGFLQVVLGGALLALTIPAWLLLGIDGGIVIAVMASSFAVIGGIAIGGRGLLQAGRAQRHLLAVNALRQLPAARVVPKS
jgi:hypothetical protein